MSSERIWTEDLSQLWGGGKWKHFLPWEEKDEDVIARNNSTARLVIYLAGISFLMRHNVKYLKYGLGGLVALAIFQKKPIVDVVEPDDEEKESVEAEGGIFDSEAVNLRVNTVPDLSSLAMEAKEAREVRFRSPKIPTREQEIFGVRGARKSHSNLKDHIYEPNRAGSQRYQSRRGNFSV